MDDEEMKLAQLMHEKAREWNETQTPWIPIRPWEEINTLTRERYLFVARAILARGVAQ